MSRFLFKTMKFINICFQKFREINYMQNFLSVTFKLGQNQILNFPGFEAVITQVSCTAEGVFGCIQATEAELQGLSCCTSLLKYVIAMTECNIFFGIYVSQIAEE